VVAQACPHPAAAGRDPRRCRRHRARRSTPGGYPLADKLAARIEQARAEQEAGANPLGLVFPAPRGGHWRSSNFNRRVLQPAYHAARWRDPASDREWTWHSLRHVFCTTALFTWKLDATDVSLSGHGFTLAHGYPPLSLGDGPILRATGGSVLYLALTALLSLGIASIIRDPGPAIGTVLGLLYSPRSSPSCTARTGTTSSSGTRP
jgi:hypothetical protein